MLLLLFQGSPPTFNVELSSDSQSSAPRMDGFGESKKSKKKRKREERKEKKKAEDNSYFDVYGGSDVSKQFSPFMNLSISL